MEGPCYLYVIWGVLAVLLFLFLFLPCPTFLITIVLVVAISAVVSSIRLCKCAA